MSSATISTESKVVSPAPPVITLQGKVAVITGASRGIGAATALALARDGAKVVVNYNAAKAEADAVVAAINSVTPDSAFAVQGDVSKSADVDRLFAEAKAKYGKIDIVFANSGISVGFRPMGETTNDIFDKVFQTNVYGTFYTLRAAANHISDNGRIVINGSISKAGTFPGCGPYAATKAAVEVLSNTLAQELGGRGITVNTIHPGPIETEAMLSQPPAIVELTKSLSPQKRMGTAAEVGNAVALLVSDGARWISGQAIGVHGAAKY